MSPCCLFVDDTWLCMPSLCPLPLALLPVSFASLVVSVPLGVSPSQSLQRHELANNVAAHVRGLVDPYQSHVTQEVRQRAREQREGEGEYATADRERRSLLSVVVVVKYVRSSVSL